MGVACVGVIMLSERRGGGFGSALAWVLVPVVPVVLENAYNGILMIADTLPRDPHDWEWAMWLMQLGPLLGFGFLAGATLSLHDPESMSRGPRGWLAHRSVWVTLGPWLGGLICAAFFVALSLVDWIIKLVDVDKSVGQLGSSQDSWLASAFYVLVLAFVAYGWLWPAVAAVRRAKRRGRAWENIQRGLAVAAAFTGSLFGSFWAITEAWRSFFFDARIVPLLIAGVGMALLSGCSSPLSYGEVRRRELFHAMLLAWMFGLAVLWRWWSRKRPSA